MRFRSGTEDYPSRSTLAEQQGYDPHPEDKLPPAAHLMPAEGVDPLTAFAAQVRQLRFVGALTRCAHPHCRNSLTEDTVTYCPHDLPFCELCVWEDSCEDCADGSSGWLA